MANGPLALYPPRPKVPPLVVSAWGLSSVGNVRYPDPLTNTTYILIQPQPAPPPSTPLHGPPPAAITLGAPSGYNTAPVPLPPILAPGVKPADPVPLCYCNQTSPGGDDTPARSLHVKLPGGPPDMSGESGCGCKPTLLPPTNVAQYFPHELGGDGAAGSSPTGGYTTICGTCSSSSNLAVEPSEMALRLQFVLPAGSGDVPVPTLYYNSVYGASSDISPGWTHTFARRLEFSASFTATIMAPDGTNSLMDYTFQSGAAGGYGSVFAAPTSSLNSASGFDRFTETQADGASFIYDHGGNLTEIRGAGDLSCSVTVMFSGSRATFRASGASSLVTLTYDTTANGRISDSTGRITTLAFSNGNLSKIVGPELCVTSFLYEPNHNLLSTVIDPLGNRTTFTYSGYQLRSIRQPLGPITTFSFNFPTNAMMDPLGRITTMTFAGGPRLGLSTLIDGDGNQTDYTYDEMGYLTGMTSPGGITSIINTTVQFDKLKRVAGIVTPGNHRFSYAYDSDRFRPTAISDQRENLYTLMYDGPQVASVKDPAGRITTYLYNGFGYGQPTGVIDPLGRRATAIYDILARRIADI